jgi:hypothetical protein
VNRFAVVGGIVKSEISRIIPTILMLNTIVNAMNPLRRYENVFTGIFWVLAKSESKARNRIAR